MDRGRSKRTNIDLAEVARLVEALERDIAKVREGSSDLATLRNEVEQLRAALEATEHEEVHSGLHGIRALLHRAGDELLGDALRGGDYLARIGRMLGM
jgi:uncharacterized membrane protein